MLNRIDALIHELDAHRPFGKELLPQVRAFYRVELTYASNAIEGFAYTESETKILLEDGLTAGGRLLRDALAVVGHAKAYDYMFSLMDRCELVVQDLLTMHRQLDGSLESGVPDEYRELPVFVTGSAFTFPPAKDIPHKMDQLAEWMGTARRQLHPVEFAVRLHLNLVTIHPFADGNVRVARLAMNAALIQQGYMVLIIPPVRRAAYMDAIRAAQLRQHEQPYFDLLYQCEIESLKDMLRLLHGEEVPNSSSQS